MHADLEAALAEWRGAEAALVLPTGYQANVAALTTFGAGAIVSDAFNHASIIDGARLAPPTSWCTTTEMSSTPSSWWALRPGRSSWSATPSSPWTATWLRWAPSRRCAPATARC